MLKQFTSEQIGARQQHKLFEKHGGLKSEKHIFYAKQRAREYHEIGGRRERDQLGIICLYAKRTVRHPTGPLAVEKEVVVEEVENVKNIRGVKIRPYGGVPNGSMYDEKESR